jgi:hypothetical protein
MKIKILSFCLAAVLFGSVNADAQNAQIRAGINFANVSVTDNGRVDDAKSLTSFHVGIVGDVPLGSTFSFQPGLLFTGKGTKTQSGDPSGSGSWYKAVTNPYYLEVPANLVFKAPIGTGTRFFAGAGPYLAVGIGGKNKVEGRTVLGTTFDNETDIEFSDDDPTTLSEEEGAGFGILRRFDYGLNGTAGIEGKSIVLGVNYGYGLAKLQSGANNSADNNNKHRVWSVTVGFKF